MLVNSQAPLVFSSALHPRSPSPAMATLLPQLHLSRGATQFRLRSPVASAASWQFPNATTNRFPSPSYCRASSRSHIPNLRIPNVVATATRIPEGFEVQGDEDDEEVVRLKDEFDWSWIPGLVAAGVITTPVGSAHAVIKDEVEEMMRFTPEAWVNIYITTGISLVFYFLLIPLGVYNYLRLRWYKRSFLETFFQFMLVFVFFPGMLLLAPFINFRPFPKDGAEEP